MRQHRIGRFGVRRIVPHIPKFETDSKKLQYMQHEAELSSRDPRIVSKASELVHDTRPDDWSAQVERIHKFVRDSIRYQHDPDRREQLAPTPVVLERGYDDCDGKARLAVALARSLGIDARVWPVWRGPMLVHVQAGYRWPGSEKYPGAHNDGWVIGELTIKWAELGQDPETIPRNPDTGRLPLA